MNYLKIYGHIKIQKVKSYGKKSGIGLRKIVKDSVGTNALMGGRKHGNLTETVIKKLTAQYQMILKKN